MQEQVISTDRFACGSLEYLFRQATTAASMKGGCKVVSLSQPDNQGPSYYSAKDCHGHPDWVISRWDRKAAPSLVDV